MRGVSGHGKLLFGWCCYDPDALFLTSLLTKRKLYNMIHPISKVHVRVHVRLKTSMRQLWICGLDLRVMLRLECK